MFGTNARIGQALIAGPAFPPPARRIDAEAGIDEAGREGLRRAGEQFADVRRADRLRVGGAEADVVDRRLVAADVPGRCPSRPSNNPTYGPRRAG